MSPVCDADWVYSEAILDLKVLSDGAYNAEVAGREKKAKAHWSILE